MISVEIRLISVIFVHGAVVGGCCVRAEVLLGGRWGESGGIAP